MINQVKRLLGSCFNKLPWKPLWKHRGENFLRPLWERLQRFLRDIRKRFPFLSYNKVLQKDEAKQKDAIKQEECSSAPTPLDTDKGDKKDVDTTLTVTSSTSNHQIASGPTSFLKRLAQSSTPLLTALGLFSPNVPALTRQCDTNPGWNHVTETFEKIYNYRNSTAFIDLDDNTLTNTPVANPLISLALTDLPGTVNFTNAKGNGDTSASDGTMGDNLGLQAEPVSLDAEPTAAVTSLDFSLNNITPIFDITYNTDYSDLNRFSDTIFTDNNASDINFDDNILTNTPVPNSLISLAFTDLPGTISFTDVTGNGDTGASDEAMGDNLGLHGGSFSLDVEPTAAVTSLEFALNDVIPIFDITYNTDYSDLNSFLDTISTDNNASDIDFDDNTLTNTPVPNSLISLAFTDLPGIISFTDVTGNGDTSASNETMVDNLGLEAEIVSRDAEPTAGVTSPDFTLSGVTPIFDITYNMDYSDLNSFSDTIFTRTSGHNVNLGDNTLTNTPVANSLISLAFTDLSGTISFTNATDNADYTGGNGMLTFAPRDTSKTLTVKVTGDKFDGNEETLALTNPTGDLVRVPAVAGTLTITGASDEVSRADTDSVTAGLENTLAFTTGNWNNPQTANGNASQGAAEFTSVTEEVAMAVGNNEATGICDRTKAVRDALVAAISGASTCGEVTASKLAGVTTLVLTFSKLTTLKAGDFNGLTALTRLYLDNTGLTTVPNLSALTSLQELHLHNNRLTSLPNLSALTNLERLYLANNSLTSLPDLSALTRLSILTLSSNPLSNLSALTLTDNVGNAIVLSPAFSGATTSYTADTNLQSVRVTPTAADIGRVPRRFTSTFPLPTIKAGLRSGTLQAVTSGSASQTITLSTGTNTLDVEVTGRARAGLATGAKRYTITVTKLGVTVATSPLSVNEGSSNTYTLVLTTQPSSNVTVTAARKTGGDTDLSISGSPLTFTNANWNTAQTLTVSAAEDDADSANGSATFEHSASSGDSNYNGSSFTISDLVANEVDNDRLRKPTVGTTPGDAQIQFSWAAQSAAQSWEYQVAAGGGAFGSWTAVPMSNSTTTGFTLSSLTNGTPYTIRVRAKNTAETKDLMVRRRRRQRRCPANPAFGSSSPAINNFILSGLLIRGPMTGSTGGCWAVTTSAPGRPYP